MLRLRTSTSLSALALVIGVVGTSWLSTLTAGWQGPANQPASTSHRLRASHRASPSRPSHAPVRVVLHRHWTSGFHPVGEFAAASAAPVAVPVELVPLSTPSDTSQPWYKLQGHLDGRVVVHVTIDGSGQVVSAGMRASSGDVVLDEHALRSIRHWRFAVPSDHPNGLSGDVPMRFASQS
jgi:protein TonB